MDSYTAQLGAGAARRLRSKEINDALWGTVALSPIDVAVLDSPLLQRLRFLRQMGAAHWVYPGAVHTRFEHAIGTLYLTQQLIDALNATARGSAKGIETHTGVQSELINSEDALLLRLGSLLSHVGHLAFSDSAVAELEAHPAFSTVTRDFARDTSPNELGADPSFTQLLAHFIVKSLAVRNLFLRLVRENVLQLHGKSDELAVDHAIDFIARAVIGRRYDEARPQLQELVSGPFDASTLDALVRDAKFSGIPSVLDIRRLIQKLAVKRTPAGKLPAWIAGSLLAIDADAIVTIFGIPATATSVLNELQLAQVLVTTKIRRHPKVLATEQMLRSVIRTIADFSSADVLLTFLYTRAEDVLIAHHEEELAIALGHGAGAASSQQGPAEKLEVAANTLTAVRERRIWVRALQLSQPTFTLTSADSQEMALLLDELSHIQRGPELIQALCAEVGGIRDVTNQPQLSEAALTAQISLRSLQPVSAEPRIGRAIVFPAGGAPTKFSDFWGGEDNWVSQYLRGQPTTYLFSAAELADTVYVAFERLADRLKATLPSGTIEASKRSKAAILELKRLANDAGFWHGYSWSIRPKPKIWDSPLIDNRIAKIALKLSKVNPAQPEDGSPDRREAIYRWLQQFETDRDTECALTMLEQLQIVDREKTAAAFHKFFADHPEYRGSYAIAFGDPKDGGVIQGYFAADQAGIGKVVTLDQWEREGDDRPLIFVDDCCGSGSQVCDVLAAWFGREDLREPLGEARDILSEAVRQRLLKTKVAFLFITAWDTGLVKIRDICAKLSIRATVWAHIPETDIPFLKGALTDGGRNAAEVDAFIARCTVIGGEILQSNGEDPGRLESRRLGYGNRGMLLATLVNVPTQTVTLLWKSGIVDGTRWEALLPRRPKK